MLAAPFVSGVSFYAFYARQPFLLDLYGDEDAYSIAGLAAAIVAGSQVVGGLLAARLRSALARRTTAIILATTTAGVVLGALALTRTFAVALLLLVLWALMGRPRRRSDMPTSTTSSPRASGPPCSRSTR